MTGSAPLFIEPQPRLILKVRRKVKAESFAAALSCAITPIAIDIECQHEPQTLQILQPVTRVSVVHSNPPTTANHA